MEPEKKGSGAMLGIVIIIIILVIGGIYIWMSSKGASQNVTNPNAQTGEAQVSQQDAAAIDSLGNEVNSANTNVNTTVQ